MVADASQRDRTRKAGGPTSHNNKSDREGCFLSRCMASLGTIGDKVSTLVDQRRGRNGDIYGMWYLNFCHGRSEEEEGGSSAG